MTATLPHLVGVIDGLDENAYHANPALSVSGAKKLLTAPALYRWEADNGQAPRQVFDVGHAAHALVLGVGAPIETVQVTAKDGTRSDAADYRSKAAQEHRDEIRAAGGTPLLASERAAVEAMADAVLTHPTAGPLFTGGRAEVSLFWRDWVTGVQRRARTDYLLEHGGGRATVVDLKTCQSAEPAALRRTVANFGYHLQHSWYVDGVHAVGLAEDVRFLFVFVEKTAPYLVTEVELDAEAVRTGRARCDEALRVFARCQETGVWPGYSDGVLTVSLPAWAAPREGWT